MRLKDVKSVVIHCETEEELQKCFEYYPSKRTRSVSDIWEKGSNCILLDADQEVSGVSSYEYYKNTSYNIVKFSDLVLPDLSATEVLEWLGKYHDNDQVCMKVFGSCACIDDFVNELGAEEVLTRIARHIEDNKIPVVGDWICNSSGKTGIVTKVMENKVCHILYTDGSVGIVELNELTKLGYKTDILEILRNEAKEHGIKL